MSSSPQADAAALVVLIGAARSGTKLLRDCLGRQKGATVVPYDVNFVWRMGSENLPHDELPATAASPRNRRQIQQQLQRWWKEPVLIEKTVSNTLRVPYVFSLFPDARFIHLIRDGYDVVESSYRQWTARPDWRYLIGKMRALPPASAPRYALRVGTQLVRRQLTRSASAPTTVWGPVYQGVSEDLRKMGVLPVVARQWRRCVDSSLSGLMEVPDDQRIEVRYENFIADPLRELKRICEFCHLDASKATLGGLEIRTSEQGKGRLALSSEELLVVQSEIEPLQRLLGY